MADATTTDNKSTSTDEQPKGRSLTTKKQKQAAKQAAKPKGSSARRIGVPVRADYERELEDLGKAVAKAFRTFKEEDFVDVRARADRLYRWARKTYEAEGLLDQVKIAQKAAEKAEREAVKAAEAAESE